MASTPAAAPWTAQPSNAAAALAPLFTAPVDGFLLLVVLGLVVIAATRGRLGLSAGTPRRGAFAQLQHVARGPVDPVPVG